jgi:hypothetical protein
MIDLGAIGVFDVQLKTDLLNCVSESAFYEAPT